MLLSIFPITVFAGIKEFKGVTIDYGNASCSTAENGDLILTYNNIGEDDLKIPEGYRAVADILVVGGGGSGSSGGKNSQKLAYGGSGGEVKTLENLVLDAGNYTVSVGDGGASVESSKNSRVAGKPGGESSVSGSDGVSLITAAGGAGGGGSAVSGEGTASEISDAHVVYGADGASRTSNAAATNGAANTGDGGSGGYSAALSGAGGSGVVIIRITDIIPLQAPEITYTIVIPKEVSVTSKGITAIGKPTVKDVENADGKIITYTAEGTDFIKSDGTAKTVKAAYYTAYTDADNNTPLGTEPITVYDGDYIAEEELTALYVFISDDEWEKAENGTYHATVTYNFEVKEIITIASILPDDFPSSDGVVPENAWVSREEGTDYHIYRNGDDLCGDGSLTLPLSTVLTETDRGYTCQTITTRTTQKSVSDYTFILSGGVLTTVEQVVRLYKGQTLQSTNTYTFVAPATQ